MQALHEAHPAAKAIRKAAVTAFEALPALLLALALMMPAFAALAA